MTNLKTMLLLSAATAILTPAGAAIAQVNDAETIIITARKKAQDLQDVPLSVGVTQGAELRDRVVTTLEDLTDGTPTVTVTRTPVGDSLYIRGVGSGPSVGFQQSVGTFVDGVYRGRGPAARSAFVDLERIEILRGPQPVYFGNSTIGGAFNIVSKGPGDELEVNLMTSYEFNADEWVTEVGVGGPITDTLGLRLAYNHTESDGFLFDTIQNRPTPSINNDSFRGTVAFDPTDNFDATLKIEYSDNSEEGGLLQVVGCNASLAPNFGPACNPPIFTTPGFEDDFDLNLSRDGIIQGVPQRDSNDLEIVNGSFAMNLDIAGGHKISSVTGFVDYTNERFLDVDGGPASFAQAQRFEDFQQWSQEFRLESPSDQRLTYMLGVYYEDATLDYLEDARTPAPFIAPSQFDQDQRTIALFGSATYELTDALNLTFGARWSSVETDATKFQQVLLTDGTPAPPPILAVAAMPGPNPRDNHDLDESRTDSDFNPSVEIQWYATDNAMLYASYKQAFKTGGFDPNLRLGSLADPANTPNDPNGAFEFDDEKAKAWEVGAKTEFFDNAVTLNIAAFRTTFEDLQVQSFDPGSNSFVTGNAGASRSQGVEIEGIWRATSYLTFNTSMTFLDGEFTDYDSAQCNNAQTAAFLAQVPPPPATAQCITSIDGQTTPFSPDFSGSAGYDFTFPIAGNLDFVSSGRVTFTTEYSWGENPDPEEIQGGFAKLDLRAGIAGNDGQWELAFVGKNLTDELTFRFLGELPGNVGRFAAADRNRELGIQARVNF